MSTNPRDAVSTAYLAASQKAESERKIVSYITDMLREQFPDENIYPQKVRYWLKSLDHQGVRKALDEGAKVLTIDIETAPTRAFIWRLFKENIPIQRIIQEGYILCVCAKFLGDAKVLSTALPDFDAFKEDLTYDKHVIEEARSWLDEADAIVAHNGNGFDIPTLNYGMFRHGLAPPSPYKKIDTLRAAKRSFRSPSNKLDWLTKVNGQEGKIGTDWALWDGCMNGDLDAWEKMVRYCKQDVTELEKFYMDMRPWIPNHPNLSVYTDCTDPQCTTCLSTNLSTAPDVVTSTIKYPGFRCNDCGTHLRGRVNTSTKEKKAATLSRSIL